MENYNESLLSVARRKQEKIVDELIEKSRPTSPYNLLLISSAVIVACGVLLDHLPIIIGGMLVTPLLTPILAIALGITCGEMELVKRSFKITLGSILIVTGIAVVFGFFFMGGIEGNVLLQNVKPDTLYFIVALVSGAAATFAWVHPNIGETLPGVAVAVSVVPPLSILGVGIGQRSVDLIRNSTVIFFLNLLGIIVGSLVVFSLMQFYKAKKEAHKRIVEEALNNKNGKDKNNKSN